MRTIYKMMIIAVRIPIFHHLEVEQVQAELIVLDFEDLSAMPHTPPLVPIPPQARLSDAFLSTHGVRFSSGSPYVAVVDLGAGQAASGINGISGSTPTGLLTYDRAFPIVASFFDPSNPFMPAVTDFVSVRGDRAGAGQSITLNAFDVNGNLITSFTATDSGGTILSVSASGIHSVQFLGTQDSGGGVALDDFTFNPVTPHVGGFLTGMSPGMGKVTCRNMTTKKTVRMAVPDGVRSWDCEQAGLVVNPGDKIRITVTVKGAAD
jgi:hypothetical protein